MTREAPTRVSVNGGGYVAPSGEADALGRVTLPHRARAATITDDADSDTESVASLSAADAFTTVRSRADRISPAALTTIASSQRGHSVGITVSGSLASASVRWDEAPTSMMLHVSVAAAAPDRNRAPTFTVAVRGVPVVLDPAGSQAADFAKAPALLLSPLDTDTKTDGAPALAQATLEEASRAASLSVGQRFSRSCSAEDCKASETTIDDEGVDALAIEIVMAKGGGLAL